MEGETEGKVSLGKRLVRILATGFYLGYVPVLPGTAGTLLGVVIYFLLMGKYEDQVWSFVLPFLAVLTVLTGWLCHRAELLFMREDDSRLVLDETIGFLWAMFALPADWRFVLLGFILFRIFDISKIFPIGQLQKLKGGLGVVADDLAAALYANLFIRFIIYLFPAVGKTF